jgi:polyisoprenyl-phosphate glycosyltransferase
MDKLRLIIPVYNDWPSFRILLREPDQVAANLTARIFVTAVNDSSTESSGTSFDITRPFS